MQHTRGLFTHATPPRQMESLFTATDILRKTKFHAFPVIRPTSEGDVFVGMITREHLTVRGRRAPLPACVRACATSLTRVAPYVPTR